MVCVSEGEQKGLVLLLHCFILLPKRSGLGVLGAEATRHFCAGPISFFSVGEILSRSFVYFDEVQHELKDIREPNVIWRVGGTD